MGEYFREKYNVDVMIDFGKARMIVADHTTGETKFTIPSSFFSNGVKTADLKAHIEDLLNK